METSRVKIIKENGSEVHRGGEKQCMNRYSSFPLCYNDIITTPSKLKITLTVLSDKCK